MRSIVNIVQSLGIAAFNDAALAERERRIINDSSTDLCADLLQRIYPCFYILEKRGIGSSEYILYVGQTDKTVLKSDQISGVRCPERHSCHEPFKIVYTGKHCAQVVSGQNVFAEILDCIQPCVNVVLISERLSDPLPELSGTHGRFAAVENSQQRTVDVLVKKRLGELEVLYACLVEPHAFCVVNYFKRFQVRYVLLLRVLEVGKQHTGRALFVTETLAYLRNVDLFSGRSGLPELRSAFFGVIGNYLLWLYPCYELNKLLIRVVAAEEGGAELAC